MLFTRFTTALACLAPLAAAWTQPKGASPKGNPIALPGLTDVLPAGDDYTITWQPTTPGTVTILLLKGPSTNAIAQFAIAEKVPNSGSFVWPVQKSLEPGQVGYGIELIDDATGQYQYSTQFGISNPGWKKDGSSSSSLSAAPGYTSTSASHKSHVTAPATSTATGYVSANATTPCSTSTAKPYLPSGSGYAGNSTVVQPTKPMTVPSSLLTTASATATPPSPPANSTGLPPQNNGAASHMAGSFVGLIVAAGVAVLAL